MEAYGLGRRFQLQAAEPNAITAGLDSMTLDIEITKHLAVGRDRRCQVLVVRIVNGGSADPNTFVAKFYDPTFCADVEPAEWPGGREQFCASCRSNETKAYKTLNQLQGTDIPIFYGEYKYQPPNDAPSQFSSAYAILLEVINHCTLGDIEPHDLAADEKGTLKDRGFALLDNIHSLGVYHHDIRADNLFWDRKKQLKLGDYEFATFKNERTTDRITEWVALDKGQLISMLEHYGIKDDRPQKAGWFTWTW
jgi:serine/threonine protein kinase